MQTFTLDHFNDFLTIARQQPAPQLLLLVLATSELPEGHTAEQAVQFLAGQGGHLAPLGGIALMPDDMADFDEFTRSASHASDKWDVVFVAAIDVPEGAKRDTVESKMIDRMVENIRAGIVNAYLGFNREGIPLTISGH